MKSTSLRIALAVALAAGLFFAVTYRDLFDGASLQRSVLDAGAGAPIALIAIYAAATVVFLPGSVLTLAAGALFGPWLGALYSLVGATIGATLAFIIARYLAGDWVSRKAGGRMKQLIDGVAAEGWHFVAFVRLVPLFPFNLVNYAFGLTRVGLAPYALTSFVAMAPGALAYAWLGHAGQQALTGSEGAVRNGMLALALLAVVAFLPRLLRRLKAAPMITPQTLRDLHAAGSVQVVDVREPADFDGETGHVPGARNIPFKEIESRLGELEPWRGGGLVLICRTQVRSGEAARLLAGRGFAGVRVVNGGMMAWRELGYPTQSSTSAELASDGRGA